MTSKDGNRGVGQVTQFKDQLGRFREEGWVKHKTSDLFNISTQVSSLLVLYKTMTVLVRIPV